MSPYDPRAVANLLLDLAAKDFHDTPVTNLALQKLLYFAHAHYLIRNHRPLVSGAFEAWKFGPVHPAVYQAFKSEADNPIKIRACGRNVITGEVKTLAVPDNQEVIVNLKAVLQAYGSLSPGRLVDISHAPKGPWATVVNKAKTSIALGLRIPDSITVECFKFHKVAVGQTTRFGEPGEDTPFVGDRPS
jgi:uncharacterized phage-associated protein